MRSARSASLTARSVGPSGDATCGGAHQAALLLRGLRFQRAAWSIAAPPRKRAVMPFPGLFTRNQARRDGLQ
jgi:hypothetical protein